MSLLTVSHRSVRLPPEHEIMTLGATVRRHQATLNGSPGTKLDADWLRTAKTDITRITASLREIGQRISAIDDPSLQRDFRILGRDLACLQNRVKCYVSRAFKSRRGAEIVVGNEEIRDELNEVVRAISPGSSLRITSDSLTPKEEQFFWGRDHRVTLPNGTQLFPYPIKSPHIGMQLRSLFISLSYDLFSEVSVGTAATANAATQSALIEQARQKGLNYQRSKCSIEGGNCYFSKNVSRETVALIGDFSLFLSMIGLEEQGCFKEQREMLRVLASEKPPSTRVLTMAKAYNRRVEKYSGKPARGLDQFLAPKGDPEAESNFWCRMGMNPLSAEEYEAITASHREVDWAFAQDIEAKLALTKRVIAAELGIPEKNIAYIPQGEFHIDMDLTPLPGGDVLVHEEAEVIKVLSSWDETRIGPLDPARLKNSVPSLLREKSFSRIGPLLKGGDSSYAKDNDLSESRLDPALKGRDYGEERFTRRFEREWIESGICPQRVKTLTAPSSPRSLKKIYLKQAERRRMQYKPMERKRREVLKEIGCRAIPVPGVYRGNREALPLNFMNALVLEESPSCMYITNGGPRSCAYLQAAFERAIPRCRIGYIRDAGVLLEKYEGGIHCLTWNC